MNLSLYHAKIDWKQSTNAGRNRAADYISIWLNFPDTLI